jgi:hypothetical protein
MIWHDRNLVAVVELFEVVVGTQTDKYTAFCHFSRDGKLEVKGKGCTFMSASCSMERWLDVILWFKFDGGGRIEVIDFKSIKIVVADIMSREIITRMGWSWNKISRKTILG